MNTDQAGQNLATTPQRTLAASVVYWLGSLRFALIVVLLIAVACIAGTLIPQGGQVDAFLARHKGAEGWMSVMSALGLTNVFYSPWFLALIILLVGSLIVCTLRRYQSMRRTTGANRIRIMGSFISHVSLLTIFAGGVIRAVWSEKAILAFHEGEEAKECSGSAPPLELPFTVKMRKFELEHYQPDLPKGKGLADLLTVRWPEAGAMAAIPAEMQASEVLAPAGEAKNGPHALRVTVERYVPDFVVDTESGEVRSRSEIPNNPALQVAVAGGGTTNRVWVFARFPEMNTHVNSDGSALPLQFRFILNSAKSSAAEEAPVKAYKSTVAFVPATGEQTIRTIAVNSPVTYGGYTFYQLSYNPEDLTWTMLQVVRDPSVPVVYAGFALMMIGLSVVFCVGPYLDDQRRKKSEGNVI